GAVEDRLDGGVTDRGEEAELVASEPEGTPAVVWDLRELDPETLEERIPGRVAEGVVVSLEAVQVEDDEQPRLGDGGAAERVVELRHQLAPVAETGERVGHCFQLRQLEEHPVLAEGDGEPDDDRGQRGDGEGQRERVEALEMVEHEDADCD